MTQLFDTTTYDQDDEPPAGRHLRSIPDLPAADSPRSTQWRLDDQTIEIGRKGIQAARQALRDSSTRSATKNRKAA